MGRATERAATVRVAIEIAVLLGVTMGLYSSNFDHAFHFDSIPGILENRFYENLEHVPTYFTDPLSLTTIRENGDYRPVLQLTFAINYWMSGHEMWSWHLVQVLLHFVCVLFVYLLCRRVLTLGGEEPPAGLSAFVPLAAGLIFAVHPTASGVVNYLWARSSLLVAALLLPAFWLYVGPPRRDRTLGHLAGAWVLYALALFTKVEAIAAVAVFFFWEVCGPQRVSRTHVSAKGLLRGVWSALNIRTLKRLAPFLVVTALYVVVREQVMPDFLAEARHEADTSRLDYLATQLVACWHYVGQWFAPVRLVADDLSFTRYQGFLHLPVLLAAAGWVLVAVGVAVLYRRRPEIAFLVLAAWALISPTSSVMPLAEMVNEHRPYLPRAFLWIGACVLLARLPLNLTAPRLPARAAVLAAVGVVSLALAWLTWSRNAVFETGESFWTDVYAKTGSWRSAHNLAVIRMKQNRLKEARDLLEQTLKQAPAWHYARINMGIVLQRLGRPEEAAEHFDAAVLYDVNSTKSRYYRARFLNAEGRFQEALRDLEACRDDPYRRLEIHVELAKAYSGLADWKKSVEHTRSAFEIDPEQTELSIVEIAKPYWSSTQGYEAGTEFFREIERFLPDRWWIAENRARLLERLGRHSESVEMRRRASRLKDVSARE